MMNTQSRNPNDLRKERVEHGITIYTRQTYADYIRRLQAASVFLVTSYKECFCLTMWEAMAAGCVVAVRRRPWIKGILPPDYPFLYSSAEEMAQGVRKILADLPAARKAIASSLKWVEEVHGLPAVQAKAKTLVEKALAESQQAFFQKHAGKDTMIGTLIEAFDPEDDLDTATEKAKGALRSDCSLSKFQLRAVLKFKRGDYAQHH